MKRSATAFRAAAALGAAAALLVAPGGCGRTDTTAPSSVRTTDVHTRFGPVDCREAKCVALTFDAGPSEHSARLLDILKEEQVPAPFFLMDRKHIDSYPTLVMLKAEEGY